MGKVGVHRLGGVTVCWWGPVRRAAERGRRREWRSLPWSCGGPCWGPRRGDAEALGPEAHGLLFVPDALMTGWTVIHIRPLKCLDCSLLCR